MELTQETISGMSAADLASSVVDLYEVSDPLKREIITLHMEERARSLGIATRFQKILKQAAKADEEFNGPAIIPAANDLESALTHNPATGKPELTIENFMTVLHNDPAFSTIRYNEFAAKAEITVNLKTAQWVDRHDSESIRHIQTRYRLEDERMFHHAFRILTGERSYHPVRQKIDSLAWDGESRVKNFLTRWMGCADTPYTQEVSRLIFAGGIHRIYEPGSKFDTVAVFIGTRTGEGKSTIVRWLAMNDEWYNVLTTIDGREGVELLQGTFVCEMDEMLAMVRAKEVEAVKSFISRQTDKYRVPWDKHPALYPRQCIFIGTTNKAQFLTDKTGNRRFMPVTVKMSGYELYKNEIECKEYIRQCWAEAKACYDMPIMSTVPDFKLLDEIKKHQRAATEDDWREDMIAEFLDAKKPGDSVCIELLWVDCLKMSAYTRPTKAESAEISTIMQRFDDWERMDELIPFEHYGRRRGWTKTGDELPF